MSGRKLSHSLGSPLETAGRSHTHTSSLGQVGNLCVTLMPHAEHRSLSVDAEDASSPTISVHTSSFELQGGCKV